MQGGGWVPALPAPLSSPLPPPGPAGGGQGPAGPGTGHHWRPAPVPAHMEQALPQVSGEGRAEWGQGLRTDQRDPRVWHQVTGCPSRSVLKIDLFSMAFLELQWLVSPLAQASPSPRTLALEPRPPRCPLPGGQAGAGPHGRGGERPGVPRDRREPVPALHQPQGALPAGPRALGEVGCRQAAVRRGQEGPAFPRLSPGSPQGWSPGPGQLPPLVPARHPLLAAEDVQRRPGSGAARGADGPGGGGAWVERGLGWGRVPVLGWGLGLEGTSGCSEAGHW